MGIYHKQIKREISMSPPGELEKAVKNMSEFNSTRYANEFYEIAAREMEKNRLPRYRGILRRTSVLVYNCPDRKSVVLRNEYSLFSEELMYFDANSNLTCWFCIKKSIYDLLTRAKNRELVIQFVGEMPVKTSPKTKTNL
jgi:hypothetical protein